MACEHVQLPDGGSAIVCGRGRKPKCACGAPSTLACDWKVPSRQSGTCDAPLCGKCGTSPAPGKDLCPAHAKAWSEWRALRGIA